MSDGRREYVVRVVIAVGAAAAAALAVLYLRHLSHMILVLFAGVLLAVALDGFARGVRSRLSVPRKSAVLASLFLIVVAFAGFGWWIGPQVADQLVGLPDRLAEVADDLAESIRSTEMGRTIWSRLSAGDGAAVSDVIGGVTGAFSTVLGVVTNLFIILFLCLYLAYDPGAYTGAIVDLFPDGPRRARTREVLDALADALRSWMVGRLISMVVLGVLTAVALLVAGVPMALGLGTIAGLFSFVPFIGPILSAVPAVLIGFGESPQTALVVVLIFLGVQGVESYLITPLVEQRVVSLPPALVITAQIVMGILFGIVGIFMATPVAVTLVVLVRMLYLEDVLGHRLGGLGA